MNQILVTGNINKPNPKEDIKPQNINNNTLYNSNINQNTNDNVQFSRDITQNKNGSELFNSNTTVEMQNNNSLFSSNSMQMDSNNSLNRQEPENVSFNNAYQSSNRQASYTNGFSIGNNSTSYNNSGFQKEKMSVSFIVKIFAIALIIFGVALLGNGSLAISQSAKQKASQKSPEVTIIRKGNVLNLSVKSEVPLRSVGYAWNSDDFQYASAKQGTEFEMTINVIEGENNKLNIAIVDMSNKKTNYREKYSKEPDTTEPEIVISNEDPRIKIVVKDDTALDHVTYKYGDNQEQTAYADISDPTRIEIYIDNIETVQSTLVVEAVDTAQNHAEVSQEVKGTTKPQITIEPISEEDPSILQITITCEDNLQKIVIYLGEQRYSTPDNISIDKKQFVQKVKVENGTTIKVNAYNVSEQMTEKTITYNY